MHFLCLLRLLPRLTVSQTIFKILPEPAGILITCDVAVVQRDVVRETQQFLTKAAN